MIFSSDRDILAMEPRLFSAAVWPQQTLVSGPGTIIAGFVNTSLDFVVPNVTAGHVCVINNNDPYEVVSRANTKAINISLVRVSSTDPPIPPPLTGNITLAVRTFAPQHALVSRAIKAKLGLIDPIDPALANDLTLRLASAAGVVAAVYRAINIGTLDPTTQQVHQDVPAIKSRIYDLYFRMLLRQAVFKLPDVNGRMRQLTLSHPELLRD